MKNLKKKNRKVFANENPKTKPYVVFVCECAYFDCQFHCFAFEADLYPSDSRYYGCE